MSSDSTVMVNPETAKQVCSAAKAIFAELREAWLEKNPEFRWDEGPYPKLGASDGLSDPTKDEPVNYGVHMQAVARRNDGTFFYANVCSAWDCEGWETKLRGMIEAGLEKLASFKSCACLPGNPCVAHDPAN